MRSRYCAHILGPGLGFQEGRLGFKGAVFGAKACLSVVAQLLRKPRNQSSVVQVPS